MGIVNDSSILCQEVCTQHSVNLSGMILPELAVDISDIHQVQVIDRYVLTVDLKGGRCPDKRVFGAYPCSVVTCVG
ncbi:MAG: hypothetical protein IJ891_09340 [Prevotella sp.]|nr:hypothetical protein [Prevotella sp.]